MNLTGKVKHLTATEVITDKFKKRLIVIETNEKYDNLVPIDFKQDKCDLLDNISLNDDVTIEINIGGREYNGKYYVSLTGWKITKNNNDAF